MKILLKIVLVMTATVAIPNAARADKACFAVEGMTCAACPLTVKAAVKKLSGVQTVNASVESKSAEVTFDPDKTNAEAVGKAINDVGYKATPKQCNDSKR